IQPMDTSNAHDTDNQIIQRVDSMDLDDLPSHTTKKVKAILPKKTSTTIPTEPLPTQTSLTQNDKKLKPKNPTGHTHTKKGNCTMQRPWGPNFPNIKFSYNNPYIAKMHMPDPNEKQQELL
ncbi:8725_t:CDS:1, partial [Gigaspora margarita]